MQLCNKRVIETCQYVIKGINVISIVHVKAMVALFLANYNNTFLR
jgi:hypothetical protein